MPCSCTGVFPRKEGWIEVLAGLAPPSQTLGSLLRIPCLAKARKIDPQKTFFKFKFENDSVISEHKNIQKFSKVTVSTCEVAKFSTKAEFKGHLHETAKIGLIFAV